MKYFFLAIASFIINSQLMADKKCIDPDPRDPNHTLVCHYLNEDFSCYDFYIAEVDLTIQKCDIFKGSEGSWYNEFPTLTPRDLNILETNRFILNENTYKHYKKCLGTTQYPDCVNLP